MESLDWVDRTYISKHKSDDPTQLRAMYYPNLSQYNSKTVPSLRSENKSPVDGLTRFLMRYGRKAVLSITVLLLSYVPYVGKFVLPAVSFYYFNSAVGPKPAVAVFGCGLVIPKRYLVRFLQSYFSSRSLMRELVSACGLLLLVSSRRLIRTVGALFQQDTVHAGAKATMVSRS